MLRSNHLRVATLLLLSLASSSAWVTPSTTTCRHPTSSMRMNFLSDIGDMMSGGKLVPQSEAPPYGEPLGGAVCDDETTLAIQERAISFTGEDFDVVNVETNQNFCRVRGAMLHLPGKDKMKIKTANGIVAATLDRKLIAFTPTYDILRGDSGDKIGWLEKAKIALPDTFLFYVEGEGGIGPFKPPAAYRLEGDFLDRRFVMKNSKDQVVAKVTMDQLIEFDAFNHYQVQVTKGMDPILVIACACAIDEEFDEEHKKRREEREKKNQ
jgi:uncharacterized protein YxjI